MSQGGSWKSRKQQIREAFLKSLQMGDDPSTTPETPGSAPYRVADAEVFSVMAGVPASPTSDTSATATAPGAKPPKGPASTTPAESTSASSESIMAWTVSPLGFTEANLKKSIVGPNGHLLPGLDPAVQSSLQALATGRAEPVEDVVLQIAEYFVEEEDERAEWTLKAAVEFYVTNYAGAAV